ncbi:hypothetical protein NL529_34180, partial [Klebsiella pneumoniae]|nr:hypothetical protein [Klebsiella pneumoniae]
EDVDDIGFNFNNALNALGSSGAISVTANAHDLGANHANAQAKFGAIGEFIYTENVTVEANAYDANAHINTFANAELI